ncbi:MAG: sigma-54-dependent Fis family transcriptional regulator [Planctomycetes bacterium]|nr:sigma-54-dependent Fis family transcriptional regulator [Planctomycetota bacterium]
MQSDTDDRDVLFALLHVLALERAELHARLKNEARYFQDEIRHERDLRTLTGDSHAIREVRRAIQQVARTDSTVLILGETGTGKELVARAIHQLSARRERLLITVNCAALNPSILTSELFGHEAGAFTGAVRRRIGRFELAQGGTLFLDEIGELPFDAQVMLLRVLQERVIERVGGNEPIAVDVRIIAATNQDLATSVAGGRFRSDLFYRMNVFPIAVPPLRERLDDIGDLARHFLHQFNRRLSRRVATIEPESLRLLQSYSWPGNVRELENIMERSMIVATCDTLRIDASWLATKSVNHARRDWKEIERQTVTAALERSQGKIYGPNGAAAALGLKPSTLYGKMRKHAIPRGPR